MTSAWRYISLFFVLLLPIVALSIFYKLIESPDSITVKSKEFKEKKSSQLTQEHKNIDANSKEILLEYKVPILMYHYVEYNENEEDFLRDKINIEPDVFEQQIIDLKDAGYEFIFLSEVADIVSKNGPALAKYVVLTFDDGYRDFYTDVFPILQKHDAKAVIYVVSNYINSENYMYDSQIRAVINSNLVELGSHTINHLNLTESSEFRVKTEIMQSKVDLEDRFIYEIKSFAYPYGAYNNTATQIVEESGYTNAVTTDPGNTASRLNLYTLPRIRPGYATGNNLIELIEKE